MVQEKIEIGISTNFLNSMFGPGRNSAPDLYIILTEAWIAAVRDSEQQLYPGFLTSVADLYDGDTKTELNNTLHPNPTNIVNAMANAALTAGGSTVVQISEFLSSLLSPFFPIKETFVFTQTPFDQIPSLKKDEAESLIRDFRTMIENKHKEKISDEILTKVRDARKNGTFHDSTIRIQSDLPPSVTIFLFYESLIQTIYANDHDHSVGNRAKQLVLLNALPIFLKKIYNDSTCRHNLSASGKPVEGPWKEDCIEFESHINAKIPEVIAARKKEMISHIDFGANLRKAIKNLKQCLILAPCKHTTHKAFDPMPLQLTYIADDLNPLSSSLSARTYRSKRDEIVDMNQKNHFEQLYTSLLIDLPKSLQSDARPQSRIETKKNFMAALQALNADAMVPGYTDNFANKALRIIHEDHKNKLDEIFSVQKIHIETRYYLEVIDNIFEKITKLSELGGGIFILASRELITPFIEASLTKLLLQKIKLEQKLNLIKYAKGMNGNKDFDKWNESYGAQAEVGLEEMIKHLNTTIFDINSIKEQLDRASKDEHHHTVIAELSKVWDELGADEKNTAEMQAALNSLMDVKARCVNEKGLSTLEILDYTGLPTLRAKTAETTATRSRANSGDSGIASSVASSSQASSPILSAKMVTQAEYDEALQTFTKTIQVETNISRDLRTELATATAQIETLQLMKGDRNASSIYLKVKNALTLANINSRLPVSDLLFITDRASNTIEQRRVVFKENYEAMIQDLNDIVQDQIALTIKTEGNINHRFFGRAKRLATYQAAVTHLNSAIGVINQLHEHICNEGMLELNTKTELLTQLEACLAQVQAMQPSGNETLYKFFFHHDEYVTVVQEIQSIETTKNVVSAAITQAKETVTKDIAEKERVRQEDQEDQEDQKVAQLNQALIPSVVKLEVDAIPARAMTPNEEFIVKDYLMNHGPNVDKVNIANDGTITLKKIEPRLFSDNEEINIPDADIHSRDVHKKELLSIILAKNADVQVFIDACIAKDDAVVTLELNQQTVDHINFLRNNKNNFKESDFVGCLYLLKAARTLEGQATQTKLITSSDGILKDFYEKELWIKKESPFFSWNPISTPDAREVDVKIEEWVTNVNAQSPHQRSTPESVLVVQYKAT